MGAIYLLNCLDCNPPCQAFSQEVLGRLQAAIQSAGTWMQDASSNLETSKQAADDALNSAKSDVDAASAEVDRTLQVFDDARTAVSNFGGAGRLHTQASPGSLASGGRLATDVRLLSSSSCRPDNRLLLAGPASQANNAVADAQQAVNDALDAFNRAQAAANQALDDAQAAFNDADAAFQQVMSAADQVVSDATDSLNAAQDQ